MKKWILMGALVATVPALRSAWSIGFGGDSCYGFEEEGWALETTLFQQGYRCEEIKPIAQKFTELKQRIEASRLSEHSKDTLIHLVRDTFVPPGEGFSGVLDSPQALRWLNSQYVASKDPEVLSITAEALQFIASFNRVKIKTWRQFDRLGAGFTAKEYAEEKYAAEDASRWLVEIHNKGNQKIRGQIDAMLNGFHSEKIDSLYNYFQHAKESLATH